MQHLDLTQNGQERAPCTVPLSKCSGWEPGWGQLLPCKLICSEHALPAALCVCGWGQALSLYLLYMFNLTTTAMCIHILYTEYTDAYQICLGKNSFIVCYFHVPLPTPTAPSQLITDCLVSWECAHKQQTQIALLRNFQVLPTGSEVFCLRDCKLLSKRNAQQCFCLGLL